MGEPARPVDFFDLKGLVETLLEELGVAGEFVKAEHPAVHPGRTAQLLVQGAPVGWLGELHPEARPRPTSKARLYLAEIDLERVLAAAGPRVRLRADCRVTPPSTATWRSWCRKRWPRPRWRRSSGGRAGHTFGKWRSLTCTKGSRCRKATVSLAYSMTYRAEDRTLKDEEVNEAVGAIEKALAAELGVTMRG